MASTKIVSFDGDDDNDRHNKPTMSKRRQHVEAQLVDPLEQPMQVDLVEHVDQVRDI